MKFNINSIKWKIYMSDVLHWPTICIIFNTSTFKSIYATASILLVICRWFLKMFSSANVKQFAKILFVRISTESSVNLQIKQLSKYQESVLIGWHMHLKVTDLFRSIWSCYSVSIRLMGVGFDTYVNGLTFGIASLGVAIFSFIYLFYYHNAILFFRYKAYRYWLESMMSNFPLHSFALTLILFKVTMQC